MLFNCDDFYLFRALGLTLGSVSEFWAKKCWAISFEISDEAWAVGALVRLKEWGLLPFDSYFHKMINSNWNYCNRVVVTSTDQDFFCWKSYYFLMCRAQVHTALISIVFYAVGLNHIFRWTNSFEWPLKWNLSMCKVYLEDHQLCLEI